MHRHQLFSVLLPVMLLAAAREVDSQVNEPADESAETYRLRVPVDEVSVTFYASDAHGLAVNDLRAEELRFLDNGRSPRKILSFALRKDLPIRAGILVDTSKSMRGHLAGDRAIASASALLLLRQKTDRAFVMDFGRLTHILQPWTSDPDVLGAGVRKAGTSGEGRLHGTAIFDTVQRACLYQFGKVEGEAGSNVILLFSDGEDNASSLSLKDAVDMCQRNRTVIYAFRADVEGGSGSTGPGTLAELTSETGGRVFHDDDSQAAIASELQMIEGDLRSRYEVVYRPAALKHDGSFHRISVLAPERVDRVMVRSGYYAPGR